MTTKSTNQNNFFWKRRESEGKREKTTNRSSNNKKLILDRILMKLRKKNGNALAYGSESKSDIITVNKLSNDMKLTSVWKYIDDNKLKRKNSEIRSVYLTSEN